MKYFSRFNRLLALAIAFTTPAAAAPFCVQNQVLPPQCIYYDAQQCSLAAQRQGATCSANPAELQLSAGNGAYCVVTSSQASVCAYVDRGTCAREAARQQGTCTDAPPRAGGVGAPDPFSAVNGN